MNQQEIQAQTILIRTGVQPLLREGTYWTEGDRVILTQLYYGGTSYNEMGIILQRSEGAIHQQLEQMGLCKRNPTSMRNRVGNTNTHKCLCKNCKCDQSLCPRSKEFMAIMEEE